MYVGAKDEETDYPPYLVTCVQSKDDGQHAGGRVATVTLGPTIMNILMAD